MQVVEKLFQERKSELMFADDVYTVLERQRVHRLYSVNDGFTRTVFKLSIWKLEKNQVFFLWVLTKYFLTMYVTGT